MVRDVKRARLVSLVPDDQADLAVADTRGWPYYEAKITAEKQGQALATALGLEVIMMRPSLLLGPGDARLSSTQIVADLLAKKVPLCPQGQVSILDVRDAAECFVRAMEHPNPKSTYLLGGPNLRLSEFFRIVEDVSGVATPHGRSVPRRVERWSGRVLWVAKRILTGKWDASLDPVFVEMGQASWVLDAGWAREDLGLAPRDATTTLRDTVMWLRENIHHNNDTGESSG